MLAAVSGGRAFGARGASIVSTTITGALQPDQLVTTDGQLWLVKGNGTGETCQIAQVDPVSLSSVNYSLPACGINATAGDGALFLETTTADVAANTYAIHVERFDTMTHTAVVFTTTSVTMFLGSDIAHTQFAFEDGWLWFYGTPLTGAAQEVLQLSPESGAVVRTYTEVPPIGGTEPVISGAGPYVWLAGGAGSNALFLRIDVATGATHRFALFRDNVSMFSVMAEAHQVFFLYVTGSGRPSQTSWHVGRMTTNGTAVSRSPNEQFGGELLAVGHDLLSPGPGQTCATGVQVWRINASTLRSTPIARVPTPAGNPCLLSAANRSVGALGSSLFYLASTSAESVLTRLTPQ